MSETAIAPKPKLRFVLWFQYGRWNLLVLVTIVAGVLAFWVFQIQHAQEHRRRYDRVQVCIDKLVQKRPTNVTVEHWNSMVWWTENLKANCLPGPFIKDEPRFRRFVSELEKKVEGDVDIETIDWIWDEVVEISTVGQTYSDQYRPTTPEGLKTRIMTW